uniref:hypothetical protein n=1 Tax=Cephaleuros parasiticus TaxID=173370 RepID=UPI001EDE2446|nr:hypothetical protein MFQ79_pgp098 [Cephaleuros parasiticus]UIB38964.1 hypothetical protein [Cephaleuros parasiticus]
MRQFFKAPACRQALLPSLLSPPKHKCRQALLSSFLSSPKHKCQRAFFFRGERFFFQKNGKGQSQGARPKIWIFWSIKGLTESLKFKGFAGGKRNKNIINFAFFIYKIIMLRAPLYFPFDGALKFTLLFQTCNFLQSELISFS